MSEKDIFVHNTAVVDAGAQIGAGSKVWHFCHVMPDAVIGNNCVLGQNVMVDNGVRIGNGCKIQNNVSIYKPAVIEDDVFCGPSCVFTNVINPRAFIERKSEFLPTVVKRGASIGANATIVCGVTLGAYCFVGAGTLIRQDVPDYALMVGVPARQLGWVCECGVSLGAITNKKVTCVACGKLYSETEGRLVPIESV